MDITALAERFDTYHAQVRAETSRIDTSVKAVSQEIEKINEQVSALLAGSGAPTDHVAGGPLNSTRLATERGAVSSFVRTGDLSDLNEIRASMSVGSDPDGGFLVAPTISQSINSKLSNEVVMRRHARIITLRSGSSWSEPISISKPGSGWYSESQTRGPLDTPKVVMKNYPLNELCSPQVVTQRLLEDSDFDLAAWLEDQMVDKFGDDEEDAFIAGDGAEKPNGILKYEITDEADSDRPFGKLQYVPSGNASTLGSTPADLLKDVSFALRAPYRRNAVWLMNSTTLSVLSKLKNSITGDYLLTPGLRDGESERLLGRPIELSESMPDIGANAFPIAFGDFKRGYTIVDRAGIRILRDPFSSNPNVVFYGHKRVGGGVTDSDAIKFVKIASE